uniref:Uncharacterized protein n=1 Tax=Salix viminalis TaxID=40686 RepID=A0A6N2LN80_SALVM
METRSFNVSAALFLCLWCRWTVCHDSQKNALRSAEADDVETDQWKMLPGMIEERDEFQGLSWEGDSMFWVVSGYSYRAATGTGCVNRDKYQWSWFLGGEQQSQQQQSREAVKVSDNVRLEIVSSTPLPNCITGTTTCVTALDYVGQEDRNHRLFVMSGGGGRLSSTLDCGERDGEGAFLSDGYSNNGTIMWKHIHTPVGFSGFPYSASSLIT